MMYIIDVFEGVHSALLSPAVHAVLDIFKQCRNHWWKVAIQKRTCLQGTHCLTGDLCGGEWQDV
jgi:hypothetical protein